MPSSVRRTARELNLSSDASYRFERGIDPGMTLRASERAAELIHEIAHGNPAAKIAIGGSVPPPPPNVLFRYQRCDQVLGIKIESETIDEILKRFGLQKSSNTGKETSWQIPSHRRDLTREVDLIEEVVRVHGINRIPARNRSRFTPTSSADSGFDFESEIRQRLVALGVSEVRTSALIPRSSSGVRFAEPGSRCAIHSARTTWRCGQACCRDC